MPPSLSEKYRSLKSATKQIETREFADYLADITEYSLGLLNGTCEEIPLVSLVPGKEYFAFRHRSPSRRAGQASSGRTSRPVNRGLFIGDPNELKTILGAFLGANYGGLTTQRTTQLLYTLAMAFCAANDVAKTGDKKTPATYFEMMIGHIFAREFGVKPGKRVNVPSVEDMSAGLPTDFIFDLGPKQAKFHLPVKLSTRERVIQVWAHQRVLNGIHGEGRFKGILVVLTETKLNLRTSEVVEICLPLQWTVYQRYVARLDRVYYLDVPSRYAMLSSTFPSITVKALGEFFTEKSALISGYRLSLGLRCPLPENQKVGMV
ncbi:MAG: hypothetical protein ACRD18_14985, partial [Terriglobia bacterium]